MLAIERILTKFRSAESCLSVSFRVLRIKRKIIHLYSRSKDAIVKDFCYAGRESGAIRYDNIM